MSWYDKLNKNCVFEKYREKIREGIEGDFSFSMVLDAFRECAKDQVGMSLDEETKKSFLEFLCSIIDLINNVYEYVAWTNAILKNNMWDRWNPVLTRLEPGKLYKRYGIMVSLGNNFDWNRYPTISCSYVTEFHPLFYGLCSEEDYADATKIGWYFRPSPNDVIGMDPTDACAVFENENVLDRYSASMMNRVGVAGGWIDGVHPSFQACYSPESMYFSKSFNEVLLKGNTRPDGVFIIYRDCEIKNSSLLDKAKEVALKMELPIVAFNWDTRIIEVSQIFKKNDKPCYHVKEKDHSRIF
jgi:hypothetical protein